jgi:hypothetical protein
VIDNVLTSIIVGINYDIKPDEVIEYLGPPDFVGYQNLGAERVMCDSYMIWADRKLVLASRFEDSESAEKFCFSVRATGKISSDMLISEVRYLSEAELSALMATGTGEFYEFTGTMP